MPRPAGGAIRRPQRPCSVCELKPEWHPHFLNQRLRDRLRAGVTSTGDAARLRRVLRAAYNGSRLVVTLMGASVTADFGGVVGAISREFLLGYKGVPASCQRVSAEQLSSCVRSGWALPVADFLYRGLLDGPAEAGGAWRPTRPWFGEGGGERSHVRLVNAAQAGHKMDAYLSCLSSKVVMRKRSRLVLGAPCCHHRPASATLLASLHRAGRCPLSLT